MVLWLVEKGAGRKGCPVNKASPAASVGALRRALYSPKVEREEASWPTRKCTVPRITCQVVHSRRSSLPLELSTSRLHVTCSSSHLSTSRGTRSISVCSLSTHHLTRS